MKHREIEPLLLSVPEAANAIRLSEHELRIWVAQGLVPCVRWRPTSHPLIPLVALHELIARHSSPGLAAPSSASDANPSGDDSETDPSTKTAGAVAPAPAGEAAGGYTPAGASMTCSPSTGAPTSAPETSGERSL